ncbi:MAG TPA: hypothetical protein PKA33_16025 [Amaricoccus sp.]|uniref:hypothetical protein n=1 Tax=Amaricoccus sp. TaxID=1872485 RepID=UPI002CC08AAE|nr:hypothetical protein [Amaricoccus sp.]HMQ92490.1 hypothetical protein [Amaricoccus sp.]HMR53861.1 hypothetical protein [Amaricoccus sp.]HMR58978.1 hypothetical protein [Amaricoccus sp.]HMU00856.1 hypothetical protein [Amaricoccus sp.]
MIALSATSRAVVDAAARRAARALAGTTTPATVGIDVALGAVGSIRDVAVGDTGALYELDRLDAATIAEAMIDAAGVARSGPRAWRRVA